MKILLISGHGGGDSGAVATINGTTYRESDLTIEVVKLIKEKLNNYCQVDNYDYGSNAFSDYKKGKLKVDFSKYNYVLEVHFNACVNDLKGNGKTTGTEIFTTKSDKTSDLELNIIKGISSFGLKNRGVKRANYSVISKAKSLKADSALLEVCFIDDRDDMKIFLNNKNDICNNIANTIINYFNLKNNNNSTISNNISVVVDKVKETINSIGDFKIRVNIEDLNIREKPSASSKIMGQTGRGTFTVVETSGEWFLLKSYSKNRNGWVNKKYCIKL